MPHMKFRYIPVIFVSLFYSICSFGQYKTVPDKKFQPLSIRNEIRFNLSNSIAGFPEINYERFISDNSGLGIAGSVSMEKKYNMPLRALLIPYFRLYFGKGFASGFFIEGNAAVASETISQYNLMGNYNYKNILTGGFGVAIGVKLLSRNGYVGELYSGLGRLYGNSMERSYPRIGICIGKRW